MDARYEHVRVDGRVISQGVLLVSGLRGDDGRREILGVAVEDTESEATYQTLFRGLKARGLSGVRLVTSDDHAGLAVAIARHFQGASWQRGQVHFTRSLTGQVAVSRRRELAAGLREVCAAETLEEAIDDCLACLAFPIEHQTRIRTTNGLERLSQELKRRTRVVRIFPSRDACLRLVTALAMEQSDEWISGWRYLDVGLLTDGYGEPLALLAVAD